MMMAISVALMARGDSWLTAQTRRVIDGSRCTAFDNTTLFVPDSSGHYTAQYTRDFCYALSSTDSAIWDQGEATSAMNYTFSRQREDGCMPDKVTADNRTGYAPGPVDSPMTDHAWDNGAFAALMLADASAKWKSKDVFCELEPRARRALAFINVTSVGLVYNDLASPNCSYGFTDNIAKTGYLLFTSLLLHDASVQMSRWSQTFGCGDAAWYARRADAVAAALDATFYDEHSGLWLAATVDNRLPDIWGSLYVVALQLSTPDRRSRAMRILVGSKNTTSTPITCSCCDDQPARRGVFAFGQVRHLPSGCFWGRCIMGACPKRGTYQNGAFWATPLIYLARAAVAENGGEFVASAAEIVAEAVRFFREGLKGFMKPPAINEAINPSISYAGAVDYVASAANALRAVHLLNLEGTLGRSAADPAGRHTGAAMPSAPSATLLDAPPAELNWTNPHGGPLNDAGFDPLMRFAPPTSPPPPKPCTVSLGGLVRGSSSSPFSYSVHEGFLSAGGDLAVVNVTSVQEALLRPC